jgi:hypothetical protein
LSARWPPEFLVGGVIHWSIHGLSLAGCGGLSATTVRNNERAAAAVRAGLHSRPAATTANHRLQGLRRVVAEMSPP